MINNYGKLKTILKKQIKELNLKSKNADEYDYNKYCIAINTLKDVLIEIDILEKKESLSNIWSK